MTLQSCDVMLILTQLNVKVEEQCWRTMLENNVEIGIIEGAMMMQGYKYVVYR
jgi:hypothetical protein